MDGATYVIAVRPEKKSEVPPDWQQILAAVAGVSVEGSSLNRAQFFANAEAIQQVESLLGEYCRIEEVASRGPL